MRGLKWVLGFVLSLSLGLIVLTGVGVYLILRNPHWVLNERTLNWAGGMIRKRGVDLVWKSVRVEVQSPGLLKKHLRLHFQDFAYKRPELGVEIRGANFQISAGAFYAQRSVHLYEVGPVELRDLVWTRSDPNGNLRGTAALRADQMPQGGGQDPAVPWKIRVDATLETSTHARAKLGGDLSLEGAALTNLAQTQIEDLHLNYRADVSWKEPPHARIIPSPPTATEAHQSRAAAARRAALKRVKRVSSPPLSREVPGRHVEAELQGTLSRNEVQSTITAQLQHLLTDLPPLNITGAQLRYQRDHGGRLSLELPASMPLPPAPKRYREFSLPKKIAIQTSTHLHFDDFLPDAQSRVRGTVDLKLDPLVHPVLTGQAHVTTQIDGRLGEFPEAGQLESHVDLTTRWQQFEDIVSGLRYGKWEVPAPLHVLRGDENFELSGDANYHEGLFPFRFKTRLGSKGQVFHIDAQGAVGFNYRDDQFNSQLNLDLLLRDIRIALPRLSLNLTQPTWSNPPKIVADPRFIHSQSEKFAEILKTERAAVGIPPSVKQEDETSASSNFKYTIKIRTPPDRPIQVLTDIVDVSIPVALDVRTSERKRLSGSVEIREFPVTAFRRKAVLDHLRLSLKDPTSEARLDGLIRIDYPEYKFRIQLSGTVDKPISRITSDPPLPERNIISALLFGRPPQELDPSQGMTVEDTQAAVTDEALSLGSLYFLSSTPIQTLTYDKATKAVVAKMNFGAGTKINLGAETDTGAPTLGISKRLAPSLDLKTDVDRVSSDPDPDLRSNSVRVKTMLQWNSRY